jgi:hypothetical protein
MRDIDDKVLAAYAEAAAQALQIPVLPEWKPAIEANLRATLRLATPVAEFELPDDSEPAPVFEA